MAELEGIPEHLRGLVPRDQAEAASAVAPLDDAELAIAVDTDAATAMTPDDAETTTLTASDESPAAPDNAERTSAPAAPDVDPPAPLAISDAADALAASDDPAAPRTASDEDPTATADAEVANTPPEETDASAVAAAPQLDPLPRSHAPQLDAGAPEDAPHDFIARALVLGANAWRAVDLGTGTGEAAIALARGLPGLYLTAVERDARSARRARKRQSKLAANVVFVTGDVQATGLPAHTCDLVISHGVAHRLADPLALFAELARLARDDAAIYLRDLRRPDSPAELAALTRQHAQDDDDAQRLADSLRAALRVAEVEQLCAAVGLTGVTVHACGEHHWEVLRARVRG